MVSFQCEACGDVQTKKRLDSHRNQCPGATFTCLDCHVHFRGTEYKSHSSCISEAQKYEGQYYKSKSNKAANRKSVSIAEPPRTSTALVPRAAYVEDDPDDPSAPPAAPSPPPAAPAIPSQPVNVFDFLVNDQSPNASRVSLGGSKAQMSMKENAPSVFSDTSGKQLIKEGPDLDEEEEFVDPEYEEQGFTYGSNPIKPSSHTLSHQNPNSSLASFEYMTPHNKASTSNRIKSASKDSEPSHSRNNSGSLEKKRKRGHVEDLDVSAANSAASSERYELEGDTMMADAPENTPALAHSGLTGGLNRLLSSSEFPPSPDYSDEKETALIRHNHPAGTANPMSPMKRTRHNREDANRSSRDKQRENNGLGLSIKGRAGRVLSMISAGGTSNSLVGLSGTNNDEKALVKTRRRTSSSEDGQTHREGERSRDRRPRKHHKVHGKHTTASMPHSNRHPSESRSSNRSKRRVSGPIERNESRPRSLKAIEYRKIDDNDESGSDSDRNRGGDSQMVVFGSEERQKKRAENFLNYIQKGPESERGCSMNKALKRWKRDVSGRREEKEEEEKELWKSLRLKKNDRGEIVVFF